METAASTKKHLWKFLVITFVLTYAYTAFVISSGGVKNFGIFGLVLMMWIPGATSLAYRYFARIGFNDVGFKFGQAKYYAIAIFAPLALASDPYEFDLLTFFHSRIFTFAQ